MHPFICPLLFIADNTLASIVACIDGFTTSTAHTGATLGVSIPSMCATLTEF